MTTAEINEYMTREATSSVSTAERARFKYLGADAGGLERKLSGYYVGRIHLRQPQGELLPRSLSNLQKVSHWLTSSVSRPWLIVMGSIGVGKTTLLEAMSEFAQSTGLVAKSVVHDARAIERVGAHVKDHYLVFIDDLGIEAQRSVDYGNIAFPMIDLLEHRYRKNRQTIISTNLTMSEISERYGLRVYDRLREMSDILTIEGVSCRSGDAL